MADKLIYIHNDDTQNCIDIPNKYLTFPEKNSPKKVREGGDIGLFIKIVPEVS